MEALIQWLRIIGKRSIVRNRLYVQISDEKNLLSSKYALIQKFPGQYHTTRQESLTRDFSSEKGVKPQEYFVYFKVLLTHFWQKRSVRIRRRICVVLA